MSRSCFFAVLLWMVVVSFPPSAVAWSTDTTRRRLVQGAAGVCITSSSVLAPSEAAASTSSNPNRPFAPPEALLPAARCKLWVDQANQLASQLPNKSDDDVDRNNVSTATTTSTVMKRLDALLSPSSAPRLFVGTEKPLSRTNAATAQLTTAISTANKQDYRRIQQTAASGARRPNSIGNQLAAMLNQADVERQWGMLQYDESQRDANNPVRAALNYYTQQLQFSGEAYVLTAAPADKKRLIRNDELPTVTSVITSDLDLRDLYRNQFLTAWDDARAEVAYQVKSSEWDTTEVVDLIKQAKTALDQWFDLIEFAEVQVAMETLRRLEETGQ